MDILNWLYLAKNKFVRTTIDNPKDLMIFGAKVGFDKRGDLYQNYAMSVEDFANSLGGGLEGESYILVKGNSDDPTVNGAELKAAYDVALASTPYGNPRGQGNEFSVIIGPGTYDMRAYNATYGWELTGDYINMISLTGEPDVVISTFSVGGNFGTYKGLNTQSAPSVGLGNYGQILLGSDTNYNVTAYFENCLAGDYSFGAAINISGSFKNCVAGVLSFGCAMNTGFLPPNVIDPPQNPNILSGSSQLTIQGNFENCTAIAASFGNVTSPNDIDIVIQSSTFRNCTAGSASFGAATRNCTIFDTIFTDCSTINGGASFGSSSNLTGTGTVSINTRSVFTNCKTRGFGFTPGQSFGYIFGPAGTGAFSLQGTFINCSAGSQSFGWTLGSGSLTGTFTNCEASDESFGFNPFVYANTNTAGIFTDCRAGLGCFGSQATGVFTNCRSKASFGPGGQAFGYGFSSADQDATGTFVSCISTGRNAFGSVSSGTPNASGSFYNCVSDSDSFGNMDGLGTSNLMGKALYCHKTSGSFYTTPGGTPKAVLCINSALTVQTI
jgi:hypothetical protein